MFKEFQKFVMRGNVIDLAVGIIMGAAFGAIVTSLVNDVIMPPIGVILGGVDFSNLYLVVKDPVVDGAAKPLEAGTSLVAAREAGASVIAYGAFINTIINFLVVAFAVFLLVRAVNNMMERFKKKEEAAVLAGPSTEEKLLTAIEKLTTAVEKKL
jgi:large conductance mechanosensitive channel